MPGFGFFNRLWLVSGQQGKNSFPIPPRVPEEQKKALQEKLKKVLEKLPSAEIGKRKILPTTPEARQTFKKWYDGRDSEDKQLIRLDQIGLRLMMIFAVNKDLDQITGDATERVISLLEWQRGVRGVLAPITG